MVPAFGGSEHRLYTGALYPWARGLDWSPDGNVSGLFGGADGLERYLDFVTFARRFHDTKAHVTLRRGDRLFAPPSRPTVRLLLSFEGSLRVRWRTSML